MLDLTLEAAYRVRLQIRGIPAPMHEGLIGYLVYGVAPGDFLQAVLCNNLSEAVRTCDPANEPYLFDYVRFLWNYAPAGAWGSAENVWRWIESHAR